MPDGRVLTGKLIRPTETIFGGKETGCSGGCEYKIRRPGLFNNEKFKGSCRASGGGCNCGALKC